MSNPFRLNAFITNDGLFTTNWKSVPPLPVAGPLPDGLYRATNPQDALYGLAHHIPDPADDEHLFLDSYWGVDLLFYLAFLPRQLNLRTDAALSCLAYPFSVIEVNVPDPSGSIRKVRESKVVIDSFQRPDPKHPGQSRTVFEINPVTQKAWAELATHLQQTYAAFKPLMSGFWPLQSALPSLPPRSSYMEPAPTRAIAVGRIHDARRRFIAVACLLVLYIALGSRKDEAGDIVWVKLLEKAKLPYFWIDEVKKSSFLSDFSGTTLRRGFHINMSVTWGFLNYRKAFFNAHLPVFFFWPKSVMENPDPDPVVRDLHPGKANLPAIRRLQDYVNMELVMAFKWHPLSGQKKGETLHDYGARLKAKTKEHEDKANANKKDAMMQRAKARRRPDGGYLWAKESRVYVWDPVPYHPFHFRRQVLSKESTSILSKFTAKQTRYDPWHDAFDCCLSLDPDTVVTYAAEEMEEDMPDWQRREEIERDKDDPMLNYMSGPAKPSSQPTTGNAEGPSTSMSQQDEEEPIPQVYQLGPTIDNEPQAPPLPEDHLMGTQPAAETAENAHGLNMAGLEDILVSRYGLHPIHNVPARYRAPDEFSIRDAVKTLAERPSRDTDIVLSEPFAACVRSFVHSLLRENASVRDIPSDMSDLSLRLNDFMHINDVHRIPRRQPTSMSIPLPFANEYNTNADPTNYFVYAHDEEGLDAILAVPSIVTFKQIFRERWGPNLQDITSRLVVCGIRFSVFWPARRLHRRIPPIPSLSDAARPPTHKYTRLDYNAYVQSRIHLLEYQPLLRAALRHGGIVWRLAIESVRPKSAVPNCSSGSLRDNFSTPHIVTVDTLNRYVDLMENVLTEEEIRVICGVYVDRSCKSFFFFACVLI